MKACEHGISVLDRCRACEAIENGDSESRSRAIRAVVAAQWGVALALGAQHYDVLVRDVGRITVKDRDNKLRAIRDIEDVAELPTPEQIVDGDA